MFLHVVQSSNSSDFVDIFHMWSELIFLTQIKGKKARLFYLFYNFLTYSLKQNFFSKQKQVKISERGKVMPDDFGENFKVILSIFNSIPITRHMIWTTFESFPSFFLLDRQICSCYFFCKICMAAQNAPMETSISLFLCLSDKYWRFCYFCCCTWSCCCCTWRCCCCYCCC